MVEGESKLVSRREPASVNGVQLGWEKRLESPKNARVQMVGRTRGDQIVVFDGEPSMKGRILQLDISDAQSLTLFGRPSPGPQPEQHLAVSCDSIPS
jgi:tRNA-2-methylthio-N6-dimethylallyladenosine synthase